MLHTLELLIVNFLLNFKADCTTHSSPCLETQYWKKYEVRCSENETIYIRQHNIGESCQEEVLGYDEKKVNSCSYSLPLSKTITDYQTPFTKTVNKCNGKRECVLFTDYFEKIESENGALCRNPNTSIFQRIEYECIPDVYVVDNCVREVDVDNQSELHDIYLRFSVMNRNHSCLLIGELSGIEILHTYSSVLRLLYQNHPVYEHLESSIGLYGVQISIQTIGLVLEMQGFDYSSYVLIKLLVRKISSGTLHVGPFHEKTEIAKGSEHLESNVFHWILTVFAALIILLVLFLIFQQRKQSSRPIAINIDGTDDRLLFRFDPGKQYSASQVEIYKAGRLCNQSEANEKLTKDNLNHQECSYSQTTNKFTNDRSYDKTRNSISQPSQHMYTPLEFSNTITEHNVENCQNEELDIYIEMLPKTN